MNIRIFIYRLIMLLGTLSIIGCQSADKKFFPYQFDAEKYQQLSNTKKVILVPTQLFNPKNTYDNETYSSLDLAIKTYLQKQGFDVFTSNQAEELWNRNKQQIGGFFDSETGEAVRSRIKEAIQKTIADLKEISGFSVAVVPNVQYRPIRLSKKSLNKAVWNGVSRTVDSSYGRRNNRWMTHIAMSLDISVIADDSSEPVFRGVGGIDFKTKNTVTGSVYSRNAKHFDETPKEHIAEAIEIAFYPFIDSPKVEKTMPDSYYKMVYRKIGFFMEYPESAKEQQLKGRVIVQFKILPSGDAEGIKVVEPSQYEIFNTQSVRSIKAASPFPNPPKGYFKDIVTVEIPLNFKPDP